MERRRAASSPSLHATAGGRRPSAPSPAPVRSRLGSARPLRLPVPARGCGAGRPCPGDEERRPRLAPPEPGPARPRHPAARSRRPGSRDRLRPGSARAARRSASRPRLLLAFSLTFSVSPRPRHSLTSLPWQPIPAPPPYTSRARCSSPRPRLSHARTHARTHVRTYARTHARAAG